MNRKIRRLCCLMGLLCISYACSDLSDDPEFQNSSITSSKFTSKEARSYFERTAEDLRSVSLHNMHPGQTKSIASGPEYGEVFTPVWNKLRQTHENDISVTVEVPLDSRGGSLQAWCESYACNRQRSQASPTQITNNLVIKKNTQTGEIFYFVATFIPDPVCAQKRKGQKYPYRFMMDRDYIGYVLLSEVTGKYITAFQHRNHSRNQVHIHIPEAGEQTDSTLVIDRLSLVIPAPVAMTKSADSEQGGITYYCTFCYSTTQYGYCTNPNCKGIEVSICGTCGNRNCVCCGLCNQYPCKCIDKNKTCSNPNCPSGGYGCNGLCGGGSSGGDGGSGSGGSGGGTGGGSGGGSSESGSTGQSSWKPGDPYPVATANPRWGLLLTEIQIKLNSILSRVNSSMANGKVIIRFRSSIENIAQVQFDPAVKNWYIDINPEDITEGSVAEKLIFLHELFHLHLYLTSGATSQSLKDNDNHHWCMVEESNFLIWLRLVFPNLSEEDYYYMKYAGTVESPIYKDLPPEKREEIEAYFNKNKIIY